MNTGIRSSSTQPGKSLVFLLVIIALAVGGWFWWNSPERKFHGDWEMSGGAMPMSTTFSFKSGGKFTYSSKLGLGGLSASEEGTGTYKVNGSAKPPTVELATVSGNGFGAGTKPATMTYQFVDSDTLQLDTPGVISVKLTLKRKK